MTQVDPTLSGNCEAGNQISDGGDRAYDPIWSKEEIEIVTSALRDPAKPMNHLYAKKHLPNKLYVEVEKFCSEWLEQDKERTEQELQPTNDGTEDNSSSSPLSNLDEDSTLTSQGKEAIGPLVNPIKISLPVETPSIEQTEERIGDKPQEMITLESVPQLDPQPIQVAPDSLAGTTAQEKILNLDEITEEEKIIHPQYFQGGRRSKNPERYKEVRNMLIAKWNSVKPKYLTKSGCYSIENIGCVTSMGKIHQYLENIGAINFGATSTRKIAPRKRSSEQLSKAPKSRQRRDSFDSDEYVNSVALRSPSKLSKRQSSRRQSSKNYNENERRSKYDSFQQFEPLKYTSRHPPPLKVKIKASAMALMEFHSHLCNHEIIGLMGGKYDSHLRNIEVTDIYACKNISAQIECEMDPFSQSKALEYFEQEGLRVVGWYHSHPTFSPNPSEVDIGTQANFQYMFRDADNGVDPFIGIIINPYSFELKNFNSDVEYIMIEEDPHTRELDTPYHIPVEYIPFAVKTEEHAVEVKEKIYQRVQKLIQEYKEHPQHVQFSDVYLDAEPPIRFSDKVKLMFTNYLNPVSSAPEASSPIQQPISIGNEYVNNQEIVSTLHQFVDDWETI